MLFLWCLIKVYPFCEAFEGPFTANGNNGNNENFLFLVMLILLNEWM